MIHAPGYPKIFILGEPHTENVFTGDVWIQEKCDGSLFCFGVNEEQDVVMRSKGRVIVPEYVDDLFSVACAYVQSIAPKLPDMFPPDTYFYCEYLKNPRHNTLNYERVPLNNLMLFDAIVNGQWLPVEQIETTAAVLGIDYARNLHHGHANMNVVKGLMETDSFLGREKIEGVVIKNYGQSIDLGHKIIPSFAKYVVERFKERHAANPDWKKSSDAVAEFIGSFPTEARWLKAFQHLRDDGNITMTMRDMPALIHEVQQDLQEEERAVIQEFFYNHYIRKINSAAVRGLAEWYKEYLIQQTIPQEKR